MNKITQVSIENIDRAVTDLRDYYEIKTGKKIERIDVCDLTDFIEFYGGSIEYANLEGEIQSVVVIMEEPNRFKIIVSNDLNHERRTKIWNEDYTELMTKKRFDLDFVKNAKEKLEKGPSKYPLNMELIRAFANYLFKRQQSELNYGDVLPTIYRSNPTQDQIDASVEIAKKLVLERKN